MVDSSAADLLRELNRVKKRTDRFPIVLIVGATLLLFLFSIGTQWWGALAVFLVICALAIYARHADVTNGTAILQYSLEADTSQQFLRVQSAFKQLAECAGVWHVETAGQTNDAKRHAGATTLVNRSESRPSLSHPRKVQLNIEVPTLKAGSKSLYFFPDHLLVYDSSGVGAVPYSQLRAQAGQTRYVEDRSAPGDATQVGTTWRYVNKKGGPDRRFNNNRQFPILLYGELGLTSHSGLNELFQCSVPDVANQVASVLSELGHKSGASQPANSPGGVEMQ